MLLLDYFPVGALPVNILAVCLMLDQVTRSPHRPIIVLGSHCYEGEFRCPQSPEKNRLHLIRHRPIALLLPEIATEMVDSVGGHETILVVEDDEQVLAVAADSLRELGYQVVTALNAAQALDILTRIVRLVRPCTPIYR